MRHIRVIQRERVEFGFGTAHFSFAGVESHFDGVRFAYSRRECYFVHVAVGGRTVIRERNRTLFANAGYGGYRLTVYFNRCGCAPSVRNVNAYFPIAAVKRSVAGKFALCSVNHELCRFSAVRIRRTVCGFAIFSVFVSESGRVVLVQNSARFSLACGIPVESEIAPIFFAGVFHVFGKRYRAACTHEYRGCGSPVFYFDNSGTFIGVTRPDVDPFAVRDEHLSFTAFYVAHAKFCSAGRFIVFYFDIVYPAGNEIVFYFVNVTVGSRPVIKHFVSVYINSAAVVAEYGTSSACFWHKFAFDDRREIIRAYSCRRRAVTPVEVHFGYLFCNRGFALKILVAVERHFKRGKFVRRQSVGFVSYGSYENVFAQKILIGSLGLLVLRIIEFERAHYRHAGHIVFVRESIINGQQMITHRQIVTGDFGFVIAVRPGRSAGSEAVVTMRSVNGRERTILRPAQILLVIRLTVMSAEVARLVRNAVHSGFYHVGNFLIKRVAARRNIARPLHRIAMRHDVLNSFITTVPYIVHVCHYERAACIFVAVSLGKLLIIMLGYRLIDIHTDGFAIYTARRRNQSPPPVTVVPPCVQTFFEKRSKTCASVCDFLRRESV